MSMKAQNGEGVKQVADVIWPKKHPFVVRGKVTFALDVVAVDHRQALAYVGEVVDGLQKELKGYWFVNSIREWEVDASHVKGDE